MKSQQLIEYIKQQLQLGRNQEEIKASLAASDWQVSDIEAVFKLVLGAPPATSDSLPASPGSPQSSSSLPGPIQILKEAWVIYKRRLKVFVGVSLVWPLAMGFLLMVVFGVGVFFGLQWSQIVSLGISGVSGIGTVILFTLLALFSIVIQTWGQTALLYAVRDRQENIGIKEAYRRGWRKIFPFWWVISLMGFFVLGGFLLFIIPGIIFWVWFSPALFVLITEDIGGMKALLKSKAYVQGYWWAVSGRFLFIGLFFFMVYLAVGLTSVIWKVLGYPFIGNILGYLILLFLSPLTTVYLFLVYQHLRILKREFVFVPTRREKILFILIGLLGFLVIPILLLVMVFMGFGSSAKLARDAGRRADLAQLQSALEIYHNEYGVYPSSLEQLEYKILPKDPKTNMPYEYQLQADSQNYQLCVHFETKPLKCVSSPFDSPLRE